MILLRLHLNSKFTHTQSQDESTSKQNALASPIIEQHCTKLLGTN